MSSQTSNATHDIEPSEDDLLESNKKVISKGTMLKLKSHIEDQEAYIKELET